MPTKSKSQKKAECAAKLTARAQELGRRPNKSDFSNEEVFEIKHFLGPWHRALEAAELKPPRKPKQRMEKPRKKKPTTTVKKTTERKEP